MEEIVQETFPVHLIRADAVDIEKGALVHEQQKSTRTEWYVQRSAKIVMQCREHTNIRDQHQYN